MESEQTGYNINVCQFLVGAKEAYLCGDTLVVSPAMWSLMESATPDELEHLMANIPVKLGPDLRKFGLLTKEGRQWLASKPIPYPRSPLMPHVDREVGRIDKTRIPPP